MQKKFAIFVIKKVIGKLTVCFALKAKSKQGSRAVKERRGLFGNFCPKYFLRPGNPW